METGKLLILLGMIASVLSIGLYAAALRSAPRWLWPARTALAVAAFASVAAFGRLMWLVVHHQFQFQYVMAYSSTELHAPFNYAATWAGQEGSFLLWTVWTGLIGLLVAWKAGRWEARVMPIYLSTLTVLFAILAWLSPFVLVKRSFGPQDYPFNAPWPPTQGMGLNPSLQNYWMAVHPPTIFFGFALLAVPFAYVVATLWWREYDTWAQRVMPWVLLSVATLGIGNMMGGYWAYETQGWHGFWAWDPVENASLFPWLAALALCHGLVVQKSRGGMAHTNLALAIGAWVLFIYGAFLTRSGALASFSVHSFVNLDNKALYLLVTLILVHTVGGFGVLIARWRSIPGRALSDRFLSRDTAMVAAVSLMTVTCLIVAVGTSWPLISRWAMLKSVGLGALYSPRGMRAEPIFFNKVGVALLIPGLLVMGAVPYLAWGYTRANSFLRKVFWPWLASVVCGFAAFRFALSMETGGFTPDTPRVVVVLITMLGAFSAITSIAITLHLLRSKALSVGGWIAHVGFALLFAGTVLTNVYERTESYMLVEDMGPVRTPFGYAVEFAGWTHDKYLDEMRRTTDPARTAALKAEMDRDWWRFDHGVRVRLIPTTGGRHGADLNRAKATTITMPVFLNRQLANRQEDGPQTMRWPYIHKEWLRDFYTLVADDPKLQRVGATLRPGQSVVLGDALRRTGYTVRYRRFFREGGMGDVGTTLGAEMEIHTPDGHTAVIRPGIRLGSAGLEHVGTEVPGIGGMVLLDGGIDASTHAVTAVFDLPDAPALWTVPIAVTNKPMINLVWLGVVLIGLGALIAMARRSAEARQLVSIPALSDSDSAPPTKTTTGTPGIL